MPIENTLIVGRGKSGTTVIATVIHNSIPGAQLFMEPLKAGFFEKLRKLPGPRVVKILYEHWRDRPFLLAGIIRGETGFRPDKIVAIVRDPRDGLISELMYLAYDRVAHGATREQVERWIGVLREKEADPEKYSVLALIEHGNRIFDTRYTPARSFEDFKSYVTWLAENEALLHVLKYEDFVAGKTADLSAYLGVELSSERDVFPGLERVARSKSPGDWRKMMLPDDVAFWRDLYGRELEAYGYADWDLRPGTIDPAVSSDYVARTTEEALKKRHSKTEDATPPSRISGAGLSEFPIPRH